MNVPDVNKIINKETEILLLINFVKNDVCDLPICVQDILNGKYENVINNKLLSNLIQECSNYSEIIHKNIEKTDLYDFWLCIGIASLLYFIQCNWTGPQVEKKH